MPKHIIVSVSNDMSTDQRVDKTCRSLLRAGYSVEVICRSLPESLPLERPYPVERMRLWFRKGPFFYMEFNLRLFLKLLGKKSDILLANDLDTLLANYLAWTNKNETQLVYDSHEYFTEVPELQGRWVKHVWERIEKGIFPKLRQAYTVNRSIADIYSKKYNVPVRVIRNLPDVTQLSGQHTRSTLALPEQKCILILQGAGININRGAEEAVEAMTILGDKFRLLVIGAGDVYDSLTDYACKLGIEDKVILKPRMPYAEMMKYTSACDIGLSLDKKGVANYNLALPNKLFDYLAAGLPVITGPTQEVKRIVRDYEVGISLDKVSASEVAEAAEKIHTDKGIRDLYAVNAVKASQTLNWTSEEKELLSIFATLD